jgi:hypothetical protein
MPADYRVTPWLRVTPVATAKSPRTPMMPVGYPVMPVDPRGTRILIGRQDISMGYRMPPGLSPAP